MDIGKAFTFVADDEEWVTKIGIGVLISLLSFLILPAFLLLGYMVRVTQNVRDGLARPLPEWKDWEQLFMDGLYVAIAQIVYTLPFWLLVCITAVATVGLGGLSEISEDLAVMSILTTWGLVCCLLIVMAVALFFLSPAIILQYVRTHDFGSLFHFGEVLAIARENMGNILIVTAVNIGASFVLSLVLGVLNAIPCLGNLIALVISIVAGPWLLAATGHLYGQIAAGTNKASSYKTDF